MSTQPESVGAGPALAWIAKQEADGREEIEHLKEVLRTAEANSVNPPPELDGADHQKAVRQAQMNLDDAIDRQMRWLKMLQLYDKSVDTSKRDSSESITREEGKKFVSMIVIYMRTATERVKENIVPRVREAASDEEGFVIVEKQFAQSFENAIQSAINQSHLPKWALEVVKSVL